MKAFRVGNFAVTIEKNLDNPNPREMYGYPGRMICWHGACELGDCRPDVSPDTYLRELMQEREWKVRRKKIADDITMEEIKQYINAHIFMLPIYMLEAENITLSTKPFLNCLEEKPIGFIYVDREDDFCEDNLKSLEDEIETYNHFLHGEFYDYSIKNADNEEVGFEQGFYGYENCKDKAVHVAQSLAQMGNP